MDSGLESFRYWKKIRFFLILGAHWSLSINKNLDKSNFDIEIIISPLPETQRGHRHLTERNDLRSWILSPAAHVSNFLTPDAKI